MKNQSIVVGMGLLMVASVPCLFGATQNNYYNQSYPVVAEATAELAPNNPDSPELQVSQGSTQYAIGSLLRTEDTHAGVAMVDSKDSKSLTTASDADDGFSKPDAYSEYRYAHIQDNRAIGFDGPQNNGIVGLDFESFFKTIVGLNFTYSNSALSTQNAGTSFWNSSNSYFLSTYAAKNFCDWINVGGSFTYGRTDTTFNSTTGGAFPFGLTQKTTQDSFAYSPFIGMAHTWGAFSLSSTPTYIYGYDHYNFDYPVTNPGTGIPAAPDAKAVNQTFLWLNNFQYAIDDKWSVSVQTNWTHLLTIQSVPTFPIAALPGLGRNWMSFGGRVDYNVNKNGTVFASFEHDAFNIHFDDYRVRTGFSYNF